MGLVKILKNKGKEIIFWWFRGIIYFWKYFFTENSLIFLVESKIVGDSEMEGAFYMFWIFFLILVKEFYERMVIVDIF